MKVKEFKNGNININLRNEPTNDILCELSDALSRKDTYIIGEEFCLNNYATGINAYNVRLEKLYTIDLYNDIKKLQEGKTIKLYARTPNEYDMEMINEWINE